MKLKTNNPNFLMLFLFNTVKDSKLNLVKSLELRKQKLLCHPSCCLVKIEPVQLKTQLNFLVQTFKVK